LIEYVTDGKHQVRSRHWL